MLSGAPGDLIFATSLNFPHFVRGRWDLRLWQTVQCFSVTFKVRSVPEAFKNQKKRHCFRGVKKRLATLILLSLGCKLDWRLHFLACCSGPITKKNRNSNQKRSVFSSKIIFCDVNEKTRKVQAPWNIIKHHWLSCFISFKWVYSWRTLNLYQQKWDFWVKILPFSTISCNAFLALKWHLRAKIKSKIN